MTRINPLDVINNIGQTFSTPFVDSFKQDLKDTPEGDSFRTVRKDLQRRHGVDAGIIRTYGGNSAGWTSPAASKRLIEHIAKANNLTDVQKSKLMSEVGADGLITVDKDSIKHGLLEHEVGHALYGRTPFGRFSASEPVRLFEQHLALPLATTLGLAGGIHTGSALKGAGLGVLAGLGLKIPELVSEYKATQYANKALADTDKPSVSMSKPLMAYAARAAGLPTAAGLLAGLATPLFKKT